MSKGNSGILSKHQAKVEYSVQGIVGDNKGYEVLKEITIRIRNHGVRSDHKVILEGRIATDDVYEAIGTIIGTESSVFHISSFDYVRFTCIVYSSYDGAELRTSGFFNDGNFVADAINVMNKNIVNSITSLEDSVCKVQEQINLINRQIEIITDHEKDEVK
jgi:hypothetical protein